jgi:hypothetical protein
MPIVSKCQSFRQQVPRRSFKREPTMPQLTNKETSQPEKVTARFTGRELALVKERAERLNISPSAFARQAILAATEATAMDRLMLAKLCKIEILIQLFFSGLFAQLNQNQRFEAEEFKAAFAKADSAQYRKADELLALYASLRSGENEQNGATNHA